MEADRLFLARAARWPCPHRNFECYRGIFMSLKTWLLRLTSRPSAMAYRCPPLWLERLEDRSVPSLLFFSQTGNWNVIRVDFSQLPPQDMTVPLWISTQYLLSQWGLGIPYTGQRTLFEIQLGTTNFRA